MRAGGTRRPRVRTIPQGRSGCVRRRSGCGYTPAPSLQGVRKLRPDEYAGDGRRYTPAASLQGAPGRGAGRAGTHRLRACMPGVNSGLASAGGARCRYTPAPSLHGCTKLGPDEYRGATWRYTPAPSSRAACKLAPHVCGGHAPPVHVGQKRTGSRKLAADVCHKNSNHGRKPPMCTEPVHMGREFARPLQTGPRRAPGPVHVCRELARTRETRPRRVPVPHSDHDRNRARSCGAKGGLTLPCVMRPGEGRPAVKWLPELQ